MAEVITSKALCSWRLMLLLRKSIIIILHQLSLTCVSIAAFFYPDTTDASELGGTARNNTAQAIAQPLVEAAAHFLVR